MKDNNSSILSEIHPENSTTVLAFGGIRNNIGIPVFEFFNILSDYQVNKIFIRDFRQSWYQLGLVNFSDSVESTRDVLKNLIPKDTKKLITIGNSAGGYASILFGTMLGADEILSFSPQTFIGRTQRLRYRDSRWSNELKKMYKVSQSTKYYDLKSILNSDTYPPIFLYYSTSDRLDKVHCNRLRMPSIEHITFESGGHNLISHLKETGQLKSILLNHINKN